jgi:hypothetical protein
LTQLTFSADGQTLFGAAGMSQEYHEPPHIPSHLFAWEVPGGELSARAPPGWARFRTNALARSPTAPLLAVGLQNESTHLARLEERELTIHPIVSNKDGAEGLWTHAQNQASGVAFSPDGRLLYLLTTEVESVSAEEPDKYEPTHSSWLRLFAIDSSTASAQVARDRIPITSLGYGLDLSPDGNLMVLSLADGRFELWAPPQPSR